MSHLNKLKILFLVISSKKYTSPGYMYIDRVDLTRKLDVINTWGTDVLLAGHDLLFIEGGSDVEYYNENSKTLHLTVNDENEPAEGLSVLLPKIQAGLRWCVQNKEFDLIYCCDNDVYVNLPEFIKIPVTADYTVNGCVGGSGGFLTRAAAIYVSNYENTHFRVADQAMFHIIMNNSEGLTCTPSLPTTQPYYIPAELYATVHYVTGKRMYYVHHTFKKFHQTGYTDRKIILGGPLDAQLRNLVVSYEISTNTKTPRSYDFITDINGWEYHGGYVRSDIDVRQMMDFWPYAENSTNSFVINIDYMLRHWKTDDELFDTYLNFLINKCTDSLKVKTNLFLSTTKDLGYYNLVGWELDNTVKESHKLNFELLNDCNFFVKSGEL